MEASPNHSQKQQANASQQTISPISNTTTAGSMPTLPASSFLETPRNNDSGISEPHQIDPLSNLAASSINTLEINAKLAMSATSHETSMSDILTNNVDREQTIMRGLPDFNSVPKALKPSPAGEELEREQLQRVRGLVMQSEADVKKHEAQPQDVGLPKGDAGVNDAQEQQHLPEPEQNLHISTSTISLAISTTLSTPVDTPLTVEENTQVPTSDATPSLKRQRSLSVQETEAILMGDAASESDDQEVEEPVAKKIRVEEQDDVFTSESIDGDKAIEVGSETRNDSKDDPKDDSKDDLREEQKSEMDIEGKGCEGEEKKLDEQPKVKTGVTWSVRQNLGLRGPDQRWRAHQIAEDYISLASSITLPPTYLGPFGYSPTTGNYPIEQVTALGYLKSPLRRPTVIEKWSPYEIVTFEAAITLHGKQFHQVQKWVKTKTTKEIVEFYYIWKKTSHYQRWKVQYEEEIEDDSGDEKDVKKKGGGSRLPVSPARRGRR